MKGIGMSDRDLQAIVTAELACEPKVDVDDIAVSADGSVVTLTGTVSSVGQKQQAQETARRVNGVSGVSNQLLVPRVEDGRGVHAAILAVGWQAFILDNLLPRQRRGSGR